MLEDLPSDYRPYILNFFREKDPIIYSILDNEKHDLRFPFKTAYYLYNLKSEKVDVIAFLSTCIIFNKYKDPIRDRASYGLSIRGNVFLERIVRNHEVSEEMTKFTNSVFIAHQMLQKIVSDQNFRWFMYKNITCDGSTLTPGDPDLNYIVIDTANVHKKIQEYQGTNGSLMRFKNEIIGRRSLTQCIEDLIDYMVNKLNSNCHKLIFMAPCHYKKDRNFDDSWYIFPIDCTEYVGQKCNENKLYGEVDDSLTMMVYDYCSFQFGAKVSLMSGDNYDYSALTQDYAPEIKRSVFSFDEPSVILSWEDILMENPNFSYGHNNRLTILEEEFGRDSV